MYVGRNNKLWAEQFYTFQLPVPDPVTYVGVSQHINTRSCQWVGKDEWVGGDTLMGTNGHRVESYQA